MTITWKNHTGNQTCHPHEIVTPRSLEELVACVQRAESEGRTVRAVGAHHAWSDVALTDGYLIEPDNLSGLMELDDDTLGPAADPDRMVRVQGGTHLRELNAALERQDKALPQMGGYDAQTIAGVVSTSTHGSGLDWGPFPSFVRSLDLVVAGGAVVRVEPSSGGPTDAAAFAERYGGERNLIQDDDTFAAAVCGMGCMGLIHSLVVDVREKFWLNEVRTLSTWEDTRDELTRDRVLGEGDHYELFLNPYARDDGKHRVLVTRRADCPEPAAGTPDDKKRRHPLTEFQASLPITGVILRFLARRLPRLMVKRFDRVLKDMRDDGYANLSYRVFNIGEANKLPAYSAELAVPIDGGEHVAAIDRILAIAAEERAQNSRYHTSPIALRFVAPSGAYASMMHGRATMMIELIMVTGTRGGFELLQRYEQELADLGVRAHWGQYNVLTAAAIAAAYPRWDDWMAVQQQFNSSGVFDSEFTKRVGISA